MHPEYAKELFDLADKADAGDIEAIKRLKDMPRLFYCGHKMLMGIGKRNARWECRNCKFQWEGEDGTSCPSCATLILS